MIKLFLDDTRFPAECPSYMYLRIKDVSIYTEKDWIIVRNYNQFVDYITKNGLPDLISFDHDLGEEGTNEKTGKDCAKWLVEYCLDNDKKLPQFLVHSINPVGYLNIKNYLESFNNR